MITNKLVTSTSTAVPEMVFTATTTGGAVNPPSVVGQTSAVTSIILCNKETPTLTDETVNSCTVSVYLVKSGQTATTTNIIVSNLIVPAGETVFFSDERIILDSGDSVWVGTSNASRVAVTVSTLPV